MKVREVLLLTFANDSRTFYSNKLTIIYVPLVQISLDKTKENYKA